MNAQRKVLAWGLVTSSNLLQKEDGMSSLPDQKKLNS
jgi:hypothetical protein